MLTALGTGVRFRIAIGFAAFASFCFVLPPAVLAFGHGANTIACMSHADAVNHGMARDHNAAKGMAHSGAAQDHDGQKSPGGDHRANCCGLFCLSAVMLAGYEASGHAPIGVPHVMAPTPRLLASVSKRPDRPPNPSCQFE